MPRRPACACGTCPRCLANAAARAAYQGLSQEERRALVAGRDPAKVRAADRARYARDRGKRLEAMGAYSKTETGRAAQKRARDKWVAANPEKRRAQQAVSNAVRDGRLVRGTVCEQADATCRGRIEAHHDDYSKPLEVRWLCVGHHRAAHHTEEPPAAGGATGGSIVNR